MSSSDPLQGKQRQAAIVSERKAAVRIEHKNNKQHKQPSSVYKWIFIASLIYLPVSFILVVQHNVPIQNQPYISLGEYSLNRIRRMQQYTASLTILRCFTTPGCFPLAKCRWGRPKKLQRKRKWTEQSFCVNDLMATNGSCLVYSFGIHENYEWEEKVAAMYGCEVHAFDPTMNHTTALAPGVTFHKLGLQADGTTMALGTYVNVDDPIDPKLLLPLDKIMRRLGHQKRTIDILMMDCEGCEWGVLHKLACTKHSRYIKQLMVEFHFQKNLGLATKDDVEQAAESVQCLWDERWHITAIENFGAGRANWVYTEGVPAILHTESMLLYVALRRIPEYESTPVELMNALAEIGSDLGQEYENADTDPKQWTTEQHNKFVPLLAKTRIIDEKYGSVARESVKFDEWERVPE